MNPVTTLIRPTVLMLALAAAFPAAAQSTKAASNEEVLKELQALRERIAVLEQELQAQKAHVHLQNLAHAQTWGTQGC